MINNQLYQIDHYGTVLNANRTYYLFRSQPPFLSAMVLELYDHIQDKSLLSNAYKTLENFYDFYMAEPHIISAELPLSRFYALGNGPCSEVVSFEISAKIHRKKVFSELLYGKSHYQRVEDFYKLHGGFSLFSHFFLTNRKFRLWLRCEAIFRL
jgi:alpha,alpha-trehalase